MVRWEPGARDRLGDAALDLFTEHGYEATTVTEIADRAGLNRRTFFRHFPDKREVLFDGQNTLENAYLEAIRDAPDAAPLDLVRRALAAAATLFPESRRDFGRRRRAVVVANPELLERELLKRSRIVTAVGAALAERGVDDIAAVLAAELCTLTFRLSYQAWATDTDDRPFDVIAASTLDRLAAVSLAEPRS